MPLSKREQVGLRRAALIQLQTAGLREDRLALQELKLAAKTYGASLRCEGDRPEKFEDLQELKVLSEKLLAKSSAIQRRSPEATIEIDDDRFLRLDRELILMIHEAELAAKPVRPRRGAPPKHSLAFLIQDLARIFRKYTTHTELGFTYDESRQRNRYSGKIFEFVLAAMAVIDPERELNVQGVAKMIPALEPRELATRTAGEAPQNANGN